MKYKVIKEFAGIVVDSEISLPAGVVSHMLTRGYVEEIPEPVKPIKCKGKAENKAITPKYKRNAT